MCKTLRMHLQERNKHSTKCWCIKDAKKAGVKNDMDYLRFKALNYNVAAFKAERAVVKAK
jgi:hypothetical protein